MNRSCLWCGRDLTGRRAHAKWCSTGCRTYWTRNKRRVETIRLRPNCLICGQRMPYRTTWQGPGVNLNATTCSRDCAVKRHNWFQRGAA